MAEISATEASKRFADLLDAGGTEAAHDVVSVAVLVADDREHGHIEDSLEELRGIHALHTTTVCTLVRNAKGVSREAFARPEG